MKIFNSYIYTQECDCKNMNYTKQSWDKIKQLIDDISEIYSLEMTQKLLLTDYYYKNYFGKAKNRTLLKDNPKLYKSIYYYSKPLEIVMQVNNRYKGWANFRYRMIFIVEKECNVEMLKCKCGDSYTWNKYCRHCPEYHKTWLGKKHTTQTKLKQKVSTLEYLSKTNGQVIPRYNINSISIIEEYGRNYGYNFQHAENGGEYHIKELGYFVDGYDVEKNVVIEIDEPHHYNSDGTLKEYDLIRENEIKTLLNCEFIRVKYER